MNSDVIPGVTGEVCPIRRILFLVILELTFFGERQPFKQVFQLFTGFMLRYFEARFLEFMTIKIIAGGDFLQEHLELLQLKSFKVHISIFG